MIAALYQGENAMREYDVHGAWLTREGAGVTVLFDLESSQPDGSFVGMAERSGGPGVSIYGSGVGSVRNNEFTYSVRWEDGLRSTHNGTFDAGGSIAGTTFDSKSPYMKHAWVCSMAFWRLKK